jgi:hypothetical protein
MQSISEKTHVPISLIAGFLSFVIGATYWAASLHSRVAQAEEAVSEVKITQKELVHEIRTVNQTLNDIRVLLAKKSK